MLCYNVGVDVMVIMEEYLLHIVNILDDGFQVQDLLPIAILTTMVFVKMGLIKMPRKNKTKLRW